MEILGIIGGRECSIRGLEALDIEGDRYEVLLTLVVLSRVFTFVCVHIGSGHVAATVKSVT